MITDYIGPNVGTNVFDSIWLAWQQGATFATGFMSGLTAGLLNIVTNIGEVSFGSTFNNTGPDVLPLVHP
ncbi:PTS sucrose transporter subunit IIBC [Prescottella defluvii]|nr:PTS sucrose transporter subunit IIBC [Prescottella defluvii]